MNHSREWFVRKMKNPLVITNINFLQLTLTLSYEILGLSQKISWENSSTLVS